MKKRKSLVASLIAIILCFSMLLGTTYAWFTDSIVNTNNIIKSGNVDVELYHTNTVVSDEEVKENTKLFVNQNGGDILWEPSASTSETFTIKNAGSLALKYKFSVKAIAKTFNGNHALLDVLTLTANGTPLAFDGELTGELVANDDVVYELEIVWNSTDNDNAYRNLQILLGVELVATQLASEYDGTGNEFDKDSQFPNLSTYVTIDKTSNEEVVLETKGKNAVSASIPATLINALPENVTSISLAHTEPIETKDENNSANNSVYFKAITLVDQEGKVIDLKNLGINETITVTLPEQNVFAKGETVSIYHDGEFIETATVGAYGVITYTTSHFSEVQVKPASWNGGSDTSWYDAKNPKTEYTFTTAEQIAGLAELCSGDTTFKNVTFKLASDIDFYCEDTSANADGDPVTFRPIGDHSKNGTFEGTFDGQGHTVSNLYQNGWDLGYEWGVYGSYGLFGNVNNATIKNLNIEGSESYIEGGDTSFVAGSATGTCVFENITIKNSISATYNNGNGGIIGWSGAGDYTFKNIKIAEDCVLAGLWGSFDSSIGGIVGQAEPGATYNFENVDIACRLDVYNDCTASYDYYNYRMCGMLIGRCEETTTIDGTSYPDTSKYNITCKDVTVTYGDWMNYHYCEPTPSNMNGGRGMRVEAGYSYGGLPTDYDHSQCVDNHMNLIPFDQIIGGDQYAVKGLKAYDGVTVVYPN